MHNKDVVIIGGGPVGITFSRRLKKLKPGTDITMFRPEEHSMVYCAIPYAIQGLFDQKEVFKGDGLVTDVGVNLLRRRVERVDLDKKQVVDDAGETYAYRTLLIATGASPVRPPIPGVEAKNVFTVKTQQDMAGIVHRIEQGAKRAVVVGAGAIGIEQAEAYRGRGIETWLIDMAPHVLPNMADPDMTDRLQREIEKIGVHLALGVTVESMDATDEGVRALRLSSGDSVALDPSADFVCFAVGMRPDVGLFRDTGLAMERDGIVVDGRMRTNLPDVYAAGDCCAFLSAIDGKPIGGKLATNAVPMAKVAARVVAGQDDEYAGFYNGAATCVGDWRIGSTGFTETVAAQRGIETVVGFGKTTTRFPMMPDSRTLQVKIVADAKDLRIVGGQVLSTVAATDKVDVITLAVQRRLTLKGLAGLSYSAQPWQSFFPARSAIVEACENALDRHGEAAGAFHYPDLPESV